MNTRAIVLRRLIIGESDLLLTLISPGLGKTRAVAKHGMKSMKRFMGQLMLFQELDVSLSAMRKSSNLLLSSSSVIESFAGLRQDLLRLASASALAELVEIAAEESRPQPRLYGLLLDGLTRIDRGPNVARHRVVYQVKLLAELGFKPCLDECACCACSLEERGAGFKIDQGGAVCEACNDGDGKTRQISAATRKALSKALELEGPRLDRLGFTRSSLKEAASLVDEFTDYYLERRLNSLAFLGKL